MPRAFTLTAALAGLAISSTLVGPGPVRAQGNAMAAGLAEEQAMTELSDTSLLERLLTDTDWPDSIFAPVFLAALPAADVRGVLTQVRETIGAPVAVTGQDGQYLAETATHSVPLTLARDGEGRITTLFFAPPDATGRTHTDILGELDALAPDVAWLITREDEVMASQNAGVPLAVGSAFKLGVLAALQGAIDAGDLGWNDVYLLADRHRSLPTGLLQNFPVDSPITVSTLAALMISQSDNTATDFLMDIVGRDPVTEALGTGTPPFTTREMFVLKAEPALRADLARLDRDEADDWDALFDAIAEAPLPRAGQIATPHSQGVEWYVPLERLCALAEEVAMNDVFSINPRPVATGAWESVAYKGGSQIGVLNLTSHLVAPNGEAYCLSVTLNGEQALDEATAIALYSALAARLQTMDPESGGDA